MQAAHLVVLPAFSLQQLCGRGHVSCSINRQHKNSHVLCSISRLRELILAARHRCSRMLAWFDLSGQRAIRTMASFALVSEVGFNNMVTEKFTGEPQARKVASSKWVCWVLYQLDASGGIASELAAGGVGFAHAGIRQYSEKAFQSQARNADARAGAAAAAEARAAAAAAKQPKSKIVVAAPVGGRNGKPDLADARSWD